MTTLRDIEAAIQSLPESELARFQQWFYAFEDDLWERKLQTNPVPLKNLAEQALQDFRDGKCTEL
ncbi:MAG: hypothetical protein JXD22_05075 [Sedimentisphaerales bacterium]|nr:hypothetical protein [Sedimentisphaerales bacterium]